MTEAGFFTGASVKGYNNVLNKYKARAGFSDLCVGYMIFKESKINAYIDSSKIIVYDFNKELTLIDDNFKKT